MKQYGISKMNKKQKKIGMVLGIILLAGLIAYFGVFDKTLSAFSRTHSDASCGNNMYTQSYSLVSQDDKSYTYQLVVIPNCVVSASDGDVGLWARETFAFIINDLPSDIQRDKAFTGQVEFVGLGVTQYAGISGQGQLDISPNYWTASKTVTCSAGEVGGYGVAQYGADGVYAYYSGIGIQCPTTLSISTALANSNYLSMGGIEKIIIDVRIPKNGIQCLDDSYCSTGLACSVNNQCVEKQIPFYRLSNNQCSPVSILSSEKTDNDYLTLSECQSKIIPVPEKPQSKGVIGFFQQINEWISNFIKSLFSLSIAGEKTIQPGSTHSYLINLSVNPADSYLNDGTLSYHFGMWGLYSKDGTLINSGSPEDVNNSYIKNVTLTTPQSIGDYALFGMVTQIDKTWNPQSGNWSTSSEYIIRNESIALKNEYSITSPEKPVSKGISFFSDFFNWLKNIWNSLFG